MKKIGRDPWRDVQILLGATTTPICFDVGAHRGETIKSMLEYFPKAIVHAFEPDPDNFAALQKAVANFPQTRLHRLALGDRQQETTLIKTHFSMSNSLLPADAGLQSSAHKKIGEVAISVTTLDQFCAEQKIETIDLLKTDCQGFDLRVLKGAAKMLSERRIRVIQCESLFVAEYEGQGWFYDILHFLSDLGYAPVSFGEPARNADNEVMWTDVIFKLREPARTVCAQTRT
jgi:FkbM family methyltransferase